MKQSVWMYGLLNFCLVLLLAGCMTAPAATQSTPSPSVTPTSRLTPTLSPSPTPTAHPSPSAMGPTRAVGGASPLVTPATQIPVYGYAIVNSYPHDPNAFTQGLIYVDGTLYEGTGLYGRSSLRRVDLESGQVEQIYNLPPQYFGEGVTLFDDRIIQLTWKARRGFVYDRTTFDLLAEFEYPTEGWGLTHNGQHLIMSDGSHHLYFLDPATFSEVKRLPVFVGERPVERLNELEYINGEVYANIWQTERIARIDPDSGRVVAWVDLTGLLSAEDRSQPVDVLNGIAYDTANERLFVTGKFWPKLFEIELVEQ